MTQNAQTSMAPEQVQPTVVYVEKQKNGFGTAALVLGILAIVVAFVPFLNVLSYILAVVAIGLGIAGLVRAQKINAGMAKTVAGLVLAVAAMGTATIVTAATVTAVDEAVSAIDAELDATDEISVQFGQAATVYGSSEVPVTITNTSDTTQTFLVTVVAESADGSVQYDSTMVTAVDLKPGQSVTETAYFLAELPADAVLSVSDAI